MQDLEPYLPETLSFMEIDNKKILLSALKKAETDDDLIIRLYNISPTKELANISLFESIIIKNVELVNLLEEKPINSIKAIISSIEGSSFKISLDPHVIATLRIKIEK